MVCVTGMVYKDGEFMEGFVETVGGENRFGQGLRVDAALKGIVIPRPVNTHTHLGDAFIRRPDGCTVEELVAPPGGLKHRLLAEVTEEEQLKAMKEGVDRMANSGVSAFLDFRESGPEGVRRLLAASLGADIVPVIFGRPAGLDYDPDELDAILGVADGIGVSAVSDWDPGTLDAMRAHVRSAGKPFALHASESRREDIEGILALEPAFVVHMVKASDRDLRRLADEDVPVVVCPTANSYFGLRAPVERMVRAGVRVCLGTDNAMLARPDMLAEMRALRAMVSADDITDKEILGIGLDNGRKVFNSDLCLGAAAGEYPDFLVLDMASGDPCGAVLKATVKNISHIQPMRRER